eukprot:1160651-Ditylum_brightwellii.AAC.1
MDLLRFDYTNVRWAYSLHSIQRLTNLGDNVAELISSRLEQLRRPVLDVIKLAACFGARVEVRTLEIVQPDMLNEINDISSLLDEACQEMMMIH